MSPEDLAGLSPVIDDKALLNRCLNNLDFAERILHLFENRGAEELKQLDDALSTGDAEAVCRIAHRLTGACANAAAIGLQARAAQLRHAASEQSLDAASQSLADLHREWERFVAAMPREKHLTPARS